MVFNKWLNGVLTWVTGNVIDETNLNACIDQVMPPISAIIAWNKSLSGVPQTLPSGWVECNGQSISDADSPMNGGNVPDLNGVSGDQRFLRGSTTSESTGGSETHNHQWLDDSEPTTFDSGGSALAPKEGRSDGSGSQRVLDAFANDGATQYTDKVSTLPSYFEIVWIIRIK